MCKDGCLSSPEEYKFVMDKPGVTKWVDVSIISVMQVFFDVQKLLEGHTRPPAQAVPLDDQMPDRS